MTNFGKCRKLGTMMSFAMASAYGTPHHLTNRYGYSTPNPSRCN